MPPWLRVSQDIDFAGSWDPMIPDAEIISLLGTVLTKLEVGEFTIKVGAVWGSALLEPDPDSPPAEPQEDSRWNFRSVRCPFRQDQEHLVSCRQAR